MAGKNVVLFAFADEAGATLSRQIDALRRNGLDWLEIRGVNGRNVCDLTETEAGEIRRRMDDAGLSVWSIGSPIGKTTPGEDDFAAECDHLRRSLVLADILGAKRIRVFSFYIPAGQQPEELRGEIIDRLGHFCDISQSSGVRLCHENEKGIYGDTAPRCRDLLDALPPLSAVFDPANFVQCRQDVRAAWVLLRDRVDYLHIKDARWDGTIVPAGEGAGCVAEIAADYLARGGRAFTLEPHLYGFGGLSALERPGEQSRILERYPDADTAFDAAYSAFADILKENGQ